jgi:polyhydroxyalkanoate synthesis regulator protein
MQSFVDIHSKLGDQTKGLGVGSTPEAWSQMLNIQNPLMQNLMGSYMEQSKDLFLKMQEQMQKSSNLFPGFPFAKTPANPAKES